MDLTQPDHSHALQPNGEWRAMLRAQVEKDLDIFRLDIEWGEEADATWQAEHLALCRVIEPLIRLDRSRLMQLIYRIDIPESRLADVLEGRQGEDAVSGIADLFLQRELQKIAIRKHYGTGGGNHAKQSDNNKAIDT